MQLKTMCIESISSISLFFRQAERLRTSAREQEKESLQNSIEMLEFFFGQNIPALLASSETENKNKIP